MANVKGGLIKDTQKKQVDPMIENKKRMQGLIISMKGEIAKALPTVLTGERFTRMLLTAMSNNPQLTLCTPTSFMGAMMQAAQLGVEPNTPLGQAYLIPYKNKGVLECQFQLGYKGLIDLAYRSGDVTIIQAHEVCENDDFTYEFGLEPKLHHVPAKTNRGEIVYFYGMFKTKAGGYGFHVMSVEEIKEHAKKYSQSYNSQYSPWTKNFAEMGKKTVLKACLKYAPIKTEFVRGMSADETIKSTLSENMTDIEDETTIDIEAEVRSEQDIQVDKETGEILNPEATDDAILDNALDLAMEEQK